MNEPFPIKKHAFNQWVQTERAAHEAWAALTAEAPKAAALMHVLVARLGEHNAVVASQKTLSELMGCSARTIRRALDILQEKRWIELRQIGETGSVNAHIVNSRVAWSGKREGMHRYSLFSATILISSAEQPDHDCLDNLEPLIPVPILFPGEAQLPTGEGLPPTSSPSLPGLELDLPAVTLDDWEDDRRLEAAKRFAIAQQRKERGEAVSFGDIMADWNPLAESGE